MKESIEQVKRERAAEIQKEMESITPQPGLFGIMQGVSDWLNNFAESPLGRALAAVGEKEREERERKDMDTITAMKVTYAQPGKKLVNNKLSLVYIKELEVFQLRDIDGGCSTDLNVFPMISDWKEKKEPQEGAWYRERGAYFKIDNVVELETVDNRLFWAFERHFLSGERDDCEGEQRFTADRITDQATISFLEHGREPYIVLKGDLLEQGGRIYRAIAERVPLHSMQTLIAFKEDIQDIDLGRA